MKRKRRARATGSATAAPPANSARRRPVARRSDSACPA